MQVIITKKNAEEGDNVEVKSFISKFILSKRHKIYFFKIL